MPWKVSSTMSTRHEFVLMAAQPKANIRALCRHFGMSSATAYKWLDRFHNEGVPGLADRSRRPHHSPQKNDTDERKNGALSASPTSCLGRS